MSVKPNMWMIPDRETAPGILLFRNRFDTAASTVLEFDYSLDVFGTVFLDGEVLEYGPERGSVRHWYMNHIRHELAAGRHELLFRVDFFNRELCAWAWMSAAHGVYFKEKSTLLKPENWQWRRLECRLFLPLPDWGQVAKVKLGTAETTGQEHKWYPVAYRPDDRALFPAELPPMRRETLTDCKREVRGNVLRITFPVYSLVFADYVFGGTGCVEVRYAEAPELLDEAIATPEGTAVYDCFELGGEDFHWFDLWFRAGKVAEFRLSGSATLKAVHFTRTGYPWQFDRMTQMPDEARLARLFAKALRTIECCTENTYMDCPYYERLQYVADSRVEMLTCYQLSSDRRLPRKALRTLALGMREDGALCCRQPTKDMNRFRIYEPTAGASPLIPAFSLFYIQMLHDYAQLREDDGLVQELLPTARRIASWAAGFLSGGILTGLPGWNFIDWLPGWENGIPPGCTAGTGCTLNWIFVQSLKDLADLEQTLGTPGRAGLYRETAQELTQAIERTFYVPERNLFAENAAHDYFSEHAQVWALLAAGRREVLPGLLSGELDRCGIYFSFYYMAVCRLYGAENAFARRLERYLSLADNPALDTLPEEFSKWRSWCHAWSSHSLYFYYAPRIGILDPIGNNHAVFLTPNERTKK